MVAPIPAGYHSITPYLMVRDANRAIAFYAQAFGAHEVMRLPMPDGKIGHAEIEIGDSRVMLADENKDCVGPQTLGGVGVSLMLYVEDVDATFARALAAGATEGRPVSDKFYGDRNGTLVDPFGHIWTIGTHREDVSTQEMERRIAAMGEHAS